MYGHEAPKGVRRKMISFPGNTIGLGENTCPSQGLSLGSELGTPSRGLVPMTREGLSSFRLVLAK